MSEDDDHEKGRKIILDKGNQVKVCDYESDAATGQNKSWQM